MIVVSMLLVHVCGHEHSSPQGAVYNLGSTATNPLTAVDVLFTGGPQIGPDMEKTVWCCRVLSINFGRTVHLIHKQ